MKIWVASLGHAALPQQTTRPLAHCHTSVLCSLRDSPVARKSSSLGGRAIPELASIRVPTSTSAVGRVSGLEHDDGTRT